MSVPFKKRKFDAGTMSNTALTRSVKTLSRKVNANRPETQYTRATSTYSPSTTGVEQFNTDLSALIANSSTKFQGQKFRNLWLKLRLDPLINASRCRLVIYRSRKPSEVFSPTTNQFVQMLDPEKYVVYCDMAFQPASEDRNGRFQDKTINLKKLITSYDNTTTSLQEGQLRAAFFTQGDNSTSAVCGWLFAFQDV